MKKASSHPPPTHTHSILIEVYHHPCVMEWCSQSVDMWMEIVVCWWAFASFGESPFLSSFSFKRHASVDCFLVGWGGGCPRPGGMLGCPWEGFCHVALCYFYVAMWYVLRGLASPRSGHVFLWFLMYLVLAFLIVYVIFQNRLGMGTCHQFHVLNINMHMIVMFGDFFDASSIKVLLFPSPTGYMLWYFVISL